VHRRRGPTQYLLDHCLSVLTAIPNAVEQARHGGQGVDDAGDGVPSGLVAADQHVVAIEQHVLGIEVAVGKQRADQVVSGPAPASCDQLVEVHKDLGVRLAGRHSVEQLVLASEGVIGQPDEHVLVGLGNTEDLAHHRRRDARTNDGRDVALRHPDDAVEQLVHLFPNPCGQRPRRRARQQRADQPT
jgi:hypothetical protein